MTKMAGWANDESDFFMMAGAPSKRAVNRNVQKHIIALQIPGTA
jgi:hypothetical protein